MVPKCPVVNVTFIYTTFDFPYFPLIFPSVTHSFSDGRVQFEKRHTRHDVPNTFGANQAPNPGTHLQEFPNLQPVTICNCFSHPSFPNYFNTLFMFYGQTLDFFAK